MFKVVGIDDDFKIKIFDDSDNSVEPIYLDEFRNYVFDLKITVDPLKLKLIDIIKQPNIGNKANIFYKLIDSNGKIYTLLCYQAAHFIESLVVIVDGLKVTSDKRVIARLQK